MKKRTRKSRAFAFVNPINLQENKIFDAIEKELRLLQ